MTKKQNTFTREELYELVWQKPLIKLAKEFGLSDVGLRKICMRNAIPTPKAGYWRRVETGKTVKKELLPKTSNKYSQTIDITGHERSTKEALKAIAFEIPERLENPHRLVAATKKAFLASKPSCEERTRPVGKNNLDIHVTKDTVERALILFDTLIKELEKREITVFVKEDYYGSTRAGKGEGNVSISIEEIFFRTESVRKESYGEFKDYAYHPTGRLCLRLPSAMSDTKQSWTDGKRYRLEDKLPEILFCIEEAITKRTKWNEESRLRKEQSERQRKLREEEEGKIKKLKLNMLYHETIRRIEQYLGELDGQIDPDWKAWVGQYLARLKEGCSINDLKEYWGNTRSDGGWNEFV